MGKTIFIFVPDKYKKNPYYYIWIAQGSTFEEVEGNANNWQVGEQKEPRKNFNKVRSVPVTFKTAIGPISGLVYELIIK